MLHRSAGCWTWAATRTASDDVAVRIAADLSASTFDSRARDDVMRWKYSKLLMNLGNSAQAACGRIPEIGDIVREARREGVACYRAAGIDWTSEEEDRERRSDLLQMRPVAGRGRAGGSSWQSLARGTGSVESDYLNGEIVMLGRLHGVPTPVNETLQAVAGRLAREHAPPGSMTVDELQAEVERRIGAEEAVGQGGRCMKAEADG